MPVAEFAVVYATIRIGLLLGERQFAAIHTRGDDDRVRFVDVLRRLNDLRRSTERHALSRIELIHHRPEALRLLLHRRNQLTPRHPQESRVVLNPCRIRDLPAHNAIFEDEHRQIHAPGIERCCQPRNPCTDDNNIFMNVFLCHPHNSFFNFLVSFTNVIVYTK